MYASSRLAYKNSTTKSSLFIPILQLNGKKFESLNEGRATRWKECGSFNNHKDMAANEEQPHGDFSAQEIKLSWVHTLRFV